MHFIVVWPKLSPFQAIQLPQATEMFTRYIFNFGITCDVIGNLEISKIRFRSMNLAGLSQPFVS